MMAALTQADYWSFRGAKTLPSQVLASPGTATHGNRVSYIRMFRNPPANQSFASNLSFNSTVNYI